MTTVDVDLLSSALVDDDGRPLFQLAPPPELSTDIDAAAMIEAERRGGWRIAERAWLDRALRPGDVFVDIGAHWGWFSLGVAARWRERVRVVAVEPNPSNLAVFMEALQHNGLQDLVELVGGAIGSHRRVATLRYRSSAVQAIGSWRIDGAPLPPTIISVVVIVLSDILELIPIYPASRVIVKLDAVGGEPQVVGGALDLLDRRSVDALMFSPDRAFGDPEQRPKMESTLAWLAQGGYRLERLDPDGRRRSVEAAKATGTILALSPGFEEM